MESNSRDCLRRDVRRAVHQACWRRLEGDQSADSQDGFKAVAEIRAAYAGADVSDEEIRRWVAEDEADFDRAILISDLVARRVMRAAPAPAAATAATPVAANAPARANAPAAAGARPADAPRPVRTAPSISTLLDDMFAQRNAAPSPAG